MRVLNDIEQNERPFIDFDINSSGESESDDEINLNCKTHPKGCRRQDNIMPNSRLSESLEDINCELMKRVDSSPSSYQPSPQTTRRLLSKSDSRVSSDDLKPSIITP